MYLAGVSTRRIEDVSELLWGAPVSSGTVSNLNERAFASIETWRQRPLEGSYPYVFVDGIYLKAQLGRVHENVAVLVAIGVNSAGDREVIGCSRVHRVRRSWREFFSWLKGDAGSPAYGSSPATSARGCSVRSRRCSPGPATSAARCISTATCWEGFRDQAEGRGAC